MSAAVSLPSAPSPEEIYNARALEFFQIGRWTLGLASLSEFKVTSGDNVHEAIGEAMSRATKHATGDRLRDLHREIRSDVLLSERVPENYVAFCMGFFANTEARARAVAAIRVGQRLLQDRKRRLDVIHVRFAKVFDELEEARGELQHAADELERLVLQVEAEEWSVA
jgi:hypothetical protein